uniref:Uncharacterized protein n=1 Tax=Triticum urartu TaxID=4572 RepID=A0A8R7V981_TRIUA
MSTHSVWKPWPHRGKNLASSPSSSSVRHTAHSTPTSSVEPFGAARYTVTGSDRRSSGSTPSAAASQARPPRGRPLGAAVRTLVLK